MKTVLLVEDNPDDVFLMERVFKKSSLDVVLKVATDGRQAIEYLRGADRFADRQQYPMPDLVLLDLKLPFLHGFQVLEWIRSQAEFAQLKVNVLTSSLEDKDQEKAHALKAPYMIKPPSLEIIRSAIDSLG